ncbi:hypothetical protein N9362_00235 [bacterium]|jgi:hypothetical protein|nr:hypothetical protein [bacterium]
MLRSGLLLLVLERGGALQDLAEGFHADVDETSISAGFQHTCGIQDIGKDFGGKLVCWGANDHGQAAPPDGEFIQVSAGHFHSCGVKIDETVKCWGMAGIGMSPGGLFLQVSAGSKHTCGILKDHTLRCWGKNSSGQADPPLGRYVQVSSGLDHSCALTDKGLAVCWGGNSHKHLNAPQDVQFKQISASFWHHSCGIDIKGDLRCWGADHAGQAPKVRALARSRKPARCARPSITHPPLPRRPRRALLQLVAGPFEQVSAGGKFTCAIRKGTGAVACWGADSFGVHGAPDAQFETVTANSQHACGLTANAKVECWGNVVHGAEQVPAGFVAA